MRHPKSARAGRRPLARQRGAALLIFLILVVTAALTYMVTNLTPEAVEAGRARQTGAALAQAREALLGYALRYRDDQIADGQYDRVYGYLPLPDLGTSRNNNTGCTLEGCDAANFTGNALNTTVVGRLPWRTLGLPPLRDGAGECLWYVVSGSHQRQQRITPMNWDTLGQLDIVVANGASALSSLIANPHDRPVAIVFAPGPPLAGQERNAAANDDVSQCGGNYDAANYLDPATAAALGGVTNYLAGSTNNASGVTGDADPANDPDAPKALSMQGKIFASGGNLLPGICQNADCALVANDAGLPVTGDLLFDALRKSNSFRTDINSLLDRMVGCLRDKIAAGSGFVPKAIAGYAPPADKSAGRIPDDGCYDDTQQPMGYYSHYSDLIFVAKAASGDLVVTEDGAPQNCPGVLLFAGQRNDGAQTRSNAGARNALANYLEDPNLSSLETVGTSFAGAGQLTRVSASQARYQDIVRCIPSGETFAKVESPALTALGVGQLVAYDAATRTLTLGKENVVTGIIGSANAAALFGCAWTDGRSLGNGLRSYFNFRFKKLGTSVGFNGFVFALADAETSSTASCGAAGTHLGYSGDNGVTPRVAWPKIGIEFDQGLNQYYLDGRDETSLLKGRNDPCGRLSCGAATNYVNSHAAIVYWGNHDVADFVAMPDYDDNVHGLPANPPLTRPPPTNPATPSAGIALKDMRGKSSEGGDSYLFHVRVEITPTRNIAAAAEDSSTIVQTQVWLLANGTDSQIAALKNTTRPMSQLDPASPPDLQDVATLYDVGTDRGGCGACGSDETCGTDNICYRQALRTLRPGFTGSQRTTDQEVHISDYFTTWIP